MDFQIRPILSALLRNRAGAVLVALQIATALAVLVNATYIVKQRVDTMNRPTGMDVENIFVVASRGFVRKYDHQSTLREDLDYLRGVEGVVAVTPMTHFPLGGVVYDDVLTVQPRDEANPKVADYYEVDHQVVDALGLRLVAGRSFAEHEILPPLDRQANAAFVPQVIVTQAYANALFPNENALGKTVYNRVGSPATIIGIVERMQGGWVGWSNVENVFLMPRLPTRASPSVHYVVRTRPGQLNRVLRTVETDMANSNPNRVIEWVRPLQFYKDRSYRFDRNMGIFLVAVTALLLSITALGIYGLSTFNVSTRVKQIGTRRALGARRLDIVRHFLVENWLITTAGIVMGSALSLGIGYWLSIEYGLPRLDLYYLLGGVLVLWAIGQLAAWQPAKRAAAISPAVATRTI